MLGVEVRDACVRILQLERTRAGLAVRACGAGAIDTEGGPTTVGRLGRIGEVIREHVESGRFKSRHCVIGVGGGALRVRSVRQPRMPRAEADKALQIEAADRLGVSDADAAQIGWIRAGDVRHGEEIREEVIVVGCERAYVERLVETVTEAGLRPVAVEPSFCAVARAIGREHRPEFNPDVVRLVIEVGAAASTVTVVRGADVTFYKRLEIGGRDFNTLAAERLGLEPETIVDLRRQRIAAGADAALEPPPKKIDRAIFDAVRPLVHELAEEVALCLRYYTVTFCGARPTVALVIGEEAGEPGLVETLAGAMNIEGAIGRPLEGIEPGPLERLAPTTASQAEWGGVLGVAMRQLAGRQVRRAAA